MSKRSASVVVPKKAIECGIAMPISAQGDIPASHWVEVRSILESSITAAGFEPVFVSEDDAAGIIQTRIVQNLYSNPIAVIDISAKNSNVMFELGMRLAFDKPTVVVKDDLTDFSFDTSPIEHLQYPRSLRFASILEFKSALKAKLQATHKKANSDAEYSTFLKHFGRFIPSKLHTTEVSKEDFIISELASIKAGLLKSQIKDSTPAKPMTIAEATRYAHDYYITPTAAKVAYENNSVQNHLNGFLATFPRPSVVDEASWQLLAAVVADQVYKRFGGR